MTTKYQLYLALPATDATAQLTGDPAASLEFREEVR